MRNKCTSGWDSNCFYSRVPSEPVADVRGKGNYPLRSTMTPLEYLTDALSECDPDDVNVMAFVEPVSIIECLHVVEEFFVCGI
jgi:hypothetical protein